ncbi:GntP family permease [Neptunomonas phycophila]|uniref:GntP family permease n=1 Tax=Neptunomonas phycophila TaxID=1572645 RepID=UPI001BEB9FCE|nr:GntP family permease [Neptunomonas phycophila]MBT3146979.1 GntP family permease [Neptunomonas phycophila]
MDIIAVVLSLVLLMYFAYRGVTVLVLAPLLAMGTVFVTGDFPMLVAWTGKFMPAAANYIQTYFPVFLTGAIFGKLMGASGCARSIARFISEKFGKERAIAAVIIATGLLVYGGVSLFVVVFAIYPIGASLFREATIPKRFLPAAIAAGAFTFAMTAIPGTPQYINTIPIPVFGTDIYAAPMIGLIGAALMCIGSIAWLNLRSSKAMAKGEGYGDHPDENIRIDGDVPAVWLAFLPIVLVFIINFVLTNGYFKSEAAVERYASFGGINGIWSVVVALSVAIVLLLVVFRKRIAEPNQEVFDGAVGGLLPIFNTASEVGYGGVIKSLAVFAGIKAAIMAIPGPPLVVVAVSTTLLAGIIGSSSGGTALAVEALGPDFLALATANGIDPGVIHRIMIMAAGGLDTLPHCGAVITLLAVTKLNHKQSYFDIAICTMAIPLIATTVVIVLATLGVV